MRNCRGTARCSSSRGVARIDWDWARRLRKLTTFHHSLETGILYGFLCLPWHLCLRYETGSAFWVLLDPDLDLNPVKKFRNKIKGLQNFTEQYRYLWKNKKQMYLRVTVILKCKRSVTFNIKFNIYRLIFPQDSLLSWAYYRYRYLFFIKNQNFPVSSNLLSTGITTLIIIEGKK
jgi:hypothetical protein